MQALIVNGDAFFNRNRDVIIELAAKYRVPAVYPWSDCPKGGGLVSYGPNLIDGFRQVGTYAGKILKGALPGELPVLQPVEFDLVLNTKAAERAGIQIPPLLLARVTELID